MIKINGILTTAVANILKNVSTTIVQLKKFVPILSKRNTTKFLNANKNAQRILIHRIRINYTLAF